MRDHSLSPAASERLHALDAVRAGALLLGVAFHASMTFLPGPQIWVVRDTAEPLLGGLFFVSHMFRMTLFFLVAGFFGRLLIERRGTGGFVKDRAKRIVLPFTLFWLPIMVLIIAAFIWGAVAMNGGKMPAAAAPPPAFGVDTFPLTHLWFLYVLTLFYLAALAVRALAGALDPSGRMRAAIVDRAVRRAMELRIAALFLALPAFLMLAAKPDWIPSVGVPTPDTGLVPNAAALTAYGTAFAFGWVLQRQKGLLDLWRRDWAAHLVIAAALSLVSLAIQGWEVPVFAPEPDTSRRMLLAGLYALAAWSWTAGLTGAAMRYLSRPSAPIRYAADASYWIYIVHLPVVMALQIAMLSLALPALVKYAIVLGVAFPILFGSYHLMVRHSWLGGWLNGRRYPRKTPPRAMETQAA